jgi:hypothetical protein
VSIVCRQIVTENLRQAAGIVMLILDQTLCHAVLLYLR